jgi:hypothetical protein
MKYPVEVKLSPPSRRLASCTDRAGSINVTSIPHTVVDGANATVALDIDIDEGAQFVFAGAGFPGLTSDQTRAIATSLSSLRGQPLNSVSVEDIFAILRPVLPACAKLRDRQQIDLDTEKHFVRVVFNFEECASRGPEY